MEFLGSPEKAAFLGKNHGIHLDFRRNIGKHDAPTFSVFGGSRKFPWGTSERKAYIPLRDVWKNFKITAVACNLRAEQFMPLID